MDAHRPAFKQEHKGSEFRVIVYEARLISFHVIRGVTSQNAESSGLQVLTWEGGWLNGDLWFGICMISWVAVAELGFSLHNEKNLHFYCKPFHSNFN